MNLLALLLGLGAERLLTRLFHLREFRWLDPLFDAAFALLGKVPRPLAAAALAVLALVLAVPVIYASLWVAAALGGIGSLAFAVLVLLFSLGPRDLEQEVDEYCAALSRDDGAALAGLARELAERDLPADPAMRGQALERAIYVQACNRTFGVVFWFLVLGPAAPAGAWAFRVADLMRRRAAFRDPPGAVHAAARWVHGLLAWVPARLTAGAFALAGGFEPAAAAWRPAEPVAAQAFYERSDRLLARVGQGARGGGTAPAEAGAGSEAALLGSAIGLVRRTLWLIWYPAIALLTLADWLH